MVPIEVVAVLDAACINKGIKDRTKLVNTILLEWARRELHAANVLVSATRGNPALSESADPALQLPPRPVSAPWPE